MIGRLTDAANYYNAQFRIGISNASILYKRVAGVFTGIGNIPGTILSGDIVSLRCIGSKISVLKNGVVVLSVTDTTYLTQTKWGMYLYNPTTTLDDFAVSKSPLNVIDHFNRANGAIGSAETGHVWTGDQWTIEGNTARRTGGTNASWVDSELFADAGTPDVEVSATILGYTRWVALILRQSTPHTTTYVLSTTLPMRGLTVVSTIHM